MASWEQAISELEAANKVLAEGLLGDLAALEPVVAGRQKVVRAIEALSAGTMTPAEMERLRAAAEHGQQIQQQLQLQQARLRDEFNRLSQQSYQLHTLAPAPANTPRLDCQG